MLTSCKSLIQQLQESTFFDYGCGHEQDLEILGKNGQNDDSNEFFDEVGKKLTDLGIDVLKLYYVVGLSLKEIGAHLNVGESRVSQLLKQYRDEIKKEWKEEE